MITRKNVKGFTLIELLVVIAIIGILATVVLASLRSAQTKSGDASVKSNLSNLRTEAELVLDSNGCYSYTTCTSTTPVVIISQACSSAAAYSQGIFKNKFYSYITAGIASGSGLASCASTVTGSAYAVSIQLKNDPLKAWCVDNRGIAKEVTLSANTQAALNATINASANCI